MLISTVVAETNPLVQLSPLFLFLGHLTKLTLISSNRKSHFIRLWTKIWFLFFPSFSFKEEIISCPLNCDKHIHTQKLKQPLVSWYWSLLILKSSYCSLLLLCFHLWSVWEATASEDRYKWSMWARKRDKNTHRDGERARMCVSPPPTITPAELPFWLLFLWTECVCVTLCACVFLWKWVWAAERVGHCACWEWPPLHSSPLIHAGLKKTFFGVIQTAVGDTYSCCHEWGG